MTLEVVNDWLVIDGRQAAAVTCSNKKYSTGKNICDYIIYHYTAGLTAKSAHNNFQNPNTEVSWHLTIDTDGTIYQLYDFRKVTWHAGKSGWVHPTRGKINGMNSLSIGIEIVNAGLLEYKNGVYHAWTGQEIAPEDVFVDDIGQGWQKFTKAQLDAAIKIGAVLAKQYKVIDALGHRDISPGRKIDPGPAFQPTLNYIRQQIRRG